MGGAVIEALANKLNTAELEVQKWQARAHLSEARLLMRDNKPKKALALLKKSLTAWPASLETMAYMVELADKGALDKAEVCFVLNKALTYHHKGQELLEIWTWLKNQD